MTGALIHQLLMAICLTESGGDPLALNYNDGKGFGNHSIGYCQVSYVTAVQLGMAKQQSCRTDLRPHKKRTFANCQLFDKSINMYYALKYLNSRLKKYDNDIKKSISAYNAGSASSKNQDYVRKVLKRFKWKK